MNKSAFNEEIKSIEEQITLAKEVDRVNTKLQTFNWIFLHPYSQGGDIAILDRLSISEKAEEQIFSFFANKFLDLRNTIHFIEGFYKKRPFLKDYSASIEESVILCLQKDFKGAISILLPVIEGTLRKYLIEIRGSHKETETNISKILNSIDGLKADYLNLEEKYLKERYSHLIASNMYFDANQVKKILNKRGEYFELWMKQFENYVEKSLYKKIRRGDSNDKFNRHVIFHALDDDIDFSFANYLRLYNCIIYLSWAIGMTNENCSVLSEANEGLVMDKWADYLKILVTSEAITQTKKSIYNKDIESFKKYMPKQYYPLIENAEQGITQILDNYNTFKNFERANIKSIPKLFRGILFMHKIRKALNEKGK